MRGTPIGPWTSRPHRWEPVSHWWPDGLPVHDRARAQQDLARRWLSRYGPAHPDDLQWWTGWTKTTTRQALSELPVEEVDLHGRPGIMLTGPDGDPDSTAAEELSPPTATLLPALDPTPMGWKHRDWLFGIDRVQVFDRAGNIGATLWWNGEVIGSWAVGPDSDILTQMIADRGSDANDAIQQAAAHLQDRLEGAVVTPAVRTRLERSLSE